jgi:hypothetical protein
LDQRHLTSAKSQPAALPARNVCASLPHKNPQTDFDQTIEVEHAAKFCQRQTKHTKNIERTKEKDFVLDISSRQSHLNFT